MAANCAGLGDSQVKPSCESRLAAASAGPGPLSKSYRGWRLFEAGCCLFERILEVVKHEPRPAFHVEKELGWD